MDPLKEVFRGHLTTVLLAGGVVFGFCVLFNTLLVFTAAYATEQLKLPNSVVLIGVVIGAIVALIGAPLAGALSDRLGRRPVVIAGSAFLALYIFPFFRLIDSKNTASI